MKKIILLSLAAALYTSLHSHAVTSVFFVGGQSNANTNYKQGIETALTSSGQFDNVLVVHINHSGTGISRWAKGSTYSLATGFEAFNNYYESDFFNASGTGALQTALTNLTNAGMTYRFDGFFWFQGESDRFNGPSWVTQYQTLMTNLRSDLGTSDWLYVATAIDTKNPADTATYDTWRGHLFDMTNSDPKGLAADSRGYTRSDDLHLTAAEGIRFGGDSAAILLAAIPEPSIFALFAGSLAVGVLGMRRRN